MSFSSSLFPAPLLVPDCWLVIIGLGIRLGRQSACCDTNIYH